MSNTIEVPQIATAPRPFVQCRECGRSLSLHPECADADGKVLCVHCDLRPAPDWLSPFEFEKAGSPLGYRNVSHKEPDTIMRLDYFRPMVPSDFLYFFADWLHEQWNERSDALMWAKREARAVAARAVAAYRVEKFTLDRSEFEDNIILIAVLEHELQELEPLEIDACKGGGYCGSFNFRRKLTRKYFDKFLDAEDRSHHGRQDWEACGFTIADLIAVQKPSDRK